MINQIQISNFLFKYTSYCALLWMYFQHLAQKAVLVENPVYMYY